MGTNTLFYVCKSRFDYGFFHALILGTLRTCECSFMAPDSNCLFYFFDGSRSILLVVDRDGGRNLFDQLLLFVLVDRPSHARTARLQLGSENDIGIYMT